MPSFFFRELQLITVLLLIRDSYMSWSSRLVSLKLCIVFSIFDSVSFLFKKKISSKRKSFQILVLGFHDNIVISVLWIF